MENKGCGTPGPLAKEYDAVGKEEECCGLDIYFNWPSGATKAVILVSHPFDYFRDDPADSSKYGGRARFNERLENHPIEGVAEDTLTIIKNLKNRKGITSVGVAGFCYGGRGAVLVAKEDSADATVFFHPSRVTVDDLKVMKGLLAIFAAEIDQTTPVALVEQYKKYLESQYELGCMVKIFPGVSHGWTVRYDEKDGKAVKAADESHSDAISWFKKYLE